MTAPEHKNGHKSRPAAVIVGAIGVVFGDIGTSPLYTVKEVFSPLTGVVLSDGNLIGAVSVIFWALMLVVSFKYVARILRADNRGEGGALALTALAASGLPTDAFHFGGFLPHKPGQRAKALEALANQTPAR